MKSPPTTEPTISPDRVAEWQRALSFGGITLLLAAIFLLSIVAGVGLAAIFPGAFSGGRAGQYAVLESVFGPYREAVRDGKLGAMAACAALVVGFNLLGSVLRTVSGVLLVPAVAEMALGGVAAGGGLLSLHGSSWISVGAFLGLVGLEWCTYVLSAAAGANVGLSVIVPRLRSRVGARREAFGRAVRSGVKAYLIIVPVLLVQAVWEILYVRQVLLHGGTGVPLEPY